MGAFRSGILYAGQDPDRFRGFVEGLTPFLPWDRGNAPLPRLFLAPHTDQLEANKVWVEGGVRWVLGGAKGGHIFLVLDSSHPDASLHALRLLSQKKRRDIGAVRSRTSAVIVLRGDRETKADFLTQVGDLLSPKGATSSLLADYPLIPWPIFVIDPQSRWDRPLGIEEIEALSALWSLLMLSPHEELLAWDAQQLKTVMDASLVKWGGKGVPPLLAEGRIALLLSSPWIQAQAQRLQNAEWRLEGRKSPLRDDPEKWADRFKNEIPKVISLNSEGISLEEEKALVESLVSSPGGDGRNLEARLLRRHGALGVDVAAMRVAKTTDKIATQWKEGLLHKATSLSAVRTRISIANALRAALNEAVSDEEKEQSKRGAAVSSSLVAMGENVGKERSRRLAKDDLPQSWFPSSSQIQRVGWATTAAIWLLLLPLMVWPWIHEPSGWQLLAYQGWQSAATFQDAMGTMWWASALERVWLNAIQASTPLEAKAIIEAATTRLFHFRLGFSLLLFLLGVGLSFLHRRRTSQAIQRMKDERITWKAEREGEPLQRSILHGARQFLESRQSFLESGLYLGGLSSALRHVESVLGWLEGQSATLEALRDQVEKTRGRLEGLASGSSFFSNLDPLALTKNRPAPPVTSKSDLTDWEREVVVASEVPKALDRYIARSPPPHQDWMNELDLRDVGSLRSGQPSDESLFVFGNERIPGEGILRGVRGGEGFESESTLPISGAETILVAGMRLGLVPRSFFKESKK
ncbi:hypothetical protein H8D30_05900 [bacterium]|nr:hypothetical protein [bacterium]